MDDTSVATVLSAWESVVGKPTAWEPLREEGDVLAVTTTAGSAFVLKEAPASRPTEPPESEYRVLCHLRAAGVPVAVPLLTEEGQPFASHDGQLYTLSPRLPEGGHAISQEETYRNTGAAIARLHAALATYSGEIKSWRMDLPARIFVEAMPVIRAHLSAVQKESLERALFTIEGEMREALTDLPMQRIHGDCHGGNILIYDGTVSGFIDCDHLPIGPRVYDLGYYLADRAKQAIGDPEREAEWLGAFAAVVQGYQALSPLSARELRAVWPVMLSTQLLFVEFFLGTGDGPAVALNLNTFHWLSERRVKIETGLHGGLPNAMD